MEKNISRLQFIFTSDMKSRSIFIKEYMVIKQQKESPIGLSEAPTRGAP